MVLNINCQQCQYDKTCFCSVSLLREQGLDENAGYLRTFTGDYGEAVRQAIQVRNKSGSFKMEFSFGQS